MHTGHHIGPYAYRISHTYMGRYTNMGQIIIKAKAGINLRDFIMYRHPTDHVTTQVFSCIILHSSLVVLYVDCIKDILKLTQCPVNSNAP